MPKKKNRGKLVKTRTKSLPGGEYMRCDVYKKAGPQGGKTVCGHVRKKKPSKNR
jgi:hypothetical protein